MQNIRRFLMRDDKGVAAVEFALVAPILLVLFLALVELTYAFSVKQRTTLVVRSVADLTSRAVGDVNDGEMQTILDASLLPMMPYDASGIRYRVSAVVVYENNEGSLIGEICWSDAYGKPTLSRGSHYPIPAGFDVDRSSFIISEIEHPYKPLIAQNFTQNVVFTDESLWPVRYLEEIPRNNVTCLPEPDDPSNGMWDDYDTGDCIANCG